MKREMLQWLLDHGMIQDFEMHPDGSYSISCLPPAEGWREFKIEPVK